MKIKCLRFLSYLFKLITGSNFVDIAEYNAIKERLQNVERTLHESGKHDAIYIDANNPKGIDQWREIAKWSDNDQARKWAFERINALLVRVAQVGPQNAHDFWIIQGALAEMNNFLNIEKRIIAKIESFREDKEESPDSLSDQHM